MSSESSSSSNDKNIEQWKIKKLIKSLEAARGNGTSMISLIIPPKDQVSRVNKMLGDEFGTASNIKSRVNRLSVLGAITSTQQRLKLYTRVPDNGLVIFCLAEGTMVSLADGTSAPIETLSRDRSEHVMAYNQTARDVRPQATKAPFFFDQGTKQCVELVLEDGTRLTATPDHRVQTSRGTVAIKDLLHDDRLLASVQGPASMAEDTTNWILSLGNLDVNLRISVPEERRRALAYARLTGYASGDRTLVEDNVMTIQCTNLLDAQAVVNDYSVLLGDVEAPPTVIENLNKATYSVTLPSHFCAQMLEHGVKNGEISDWMLSNEVPTSFLREFVAALFGANSPCITKDSVSGFSQLRLCRNGPVDHMSRLAAVLADRFGVKGSTVRVEQGSSRVTLEIPASATLPFYESIGLRYSNSKLVRLAVASAWHRGADVSAGEFLAKVGATELFQRKEMDDCGMAVWTLGVVSQRSVGPRRVYDIHVGGDELFVAQGVVVHNCGTIITGEGKEKKVNIDFEPFKPINTSLYLCDNKFHTEPLNELLESDEKFGFIIIDGNGALFGTLSGNTRTVLHRITVDLPKKHGRGGQSALRFARLRLEKRHNYVRKVAELSVQFFITTDRPNVSGLIVAGSADFKSELSMSDMFDQRLRAVILKIVDVSYGGDNGFNQAIELSSEVLQNVKFIQEKKLVSAFFEEISQDTGRYCFGVMDTLRALDLGAVHTLIVWENLEINRYVLKNVAGVERVIHLTKEQEKDSRHFKDPDSSLDLEIIDCLPLIEWFANEYKSFGATLEFITNRSQEGSQFCKGFGGIGGLLRYKLDLVALNEYDNQDEYNADSDEEF